MRWVLNTYQTAQNWPVERIIEICQKTGYEGIEFLQDFKQAHQLEADAPPELLPEIKAKMEAAGLIISSLTSCCYFHDLEETERIAALRQRTG